MRVWSDTAATREHRKKEEKYIATNTAYPYNGKTLTQLSNIDLFLM